MRHSRSGIRHKRSTPFTTFNNDVSPEVVRRLLDHTQPHHGRPRCPPAWPTRQSEPIGSAPERSTSTAAEWMNHNLACARLALPTCHRVSELLTKMRANNSIHLTTAATRRHETTRAKSLAALHDLDQTGCPISFTAVAEHASVSRSWLYTHTDVKDEIRRMQAPREPAPVTSSANQQPASDASLRNWLRLADQRNRELDEENRGLRD